MTGHVCTFAGHVAVQNLSVGNRDRQKSAYDSRCFVSRFAARSLGCLKTALANKVQARPRLQTCALTRLERQVCHSSHVRT